MIRCFVIFLALLALELHAADTNAAVTNAVEVNAMVTNSATTNTFNTNALRLIKTIFLPNVSGRVDHFAMDAQGRRLFLAALGNGTVEVMDLVASKHIGTIGNCSSPQGLAFLAAKNRLVVANGSSSTVKILDGISFKPVNTLGDMPEADNLRYDAKADLLYVAYGNALAVIQAASGEVVGTIKLAGHPESFQLESVGNRIFVNVPEAQQVAVIDRDQRITIDMWPIKGSNFPMALDEANHRLFIGSRAPGRLVVMDTITGNKVDNLQISDDADDLYYDAGRKLIYASCGDGFLDVIAQNDPDTYQLLQRVPTAPGARTSYFSPERSELYLALPASMMSGRAEIRIYKCSP